MPSFPPHSVVPLISTIQYLYIKRNSIRNWFFWTWQTTDVFVRRSICWVYCEACIQPWWKCSESSRQVTFLLPRERLLVAFTGLSRLNTRKPDKCQVFLKNIRSYISLLFVPPLSSTLRFHRLLSPWCLSLLHNVSASRVTSTVWSSSLLSRLHALFLFISVFLFFLSTLDHFSLICSFLLFLIIISLSLVLSQNLEGDKITKLWIIWLS